MRHHSKIKKFDRTSTQRTALFRSLSISLAEKGSIKTTVAKAKYLRPIIEKLITCAKKDTVASKRLLASNLGSGGDVTAFTKTMVELFKDRASGYTRITKLPKRAKDASPMAIIELVK